MPRLTILIPCLGGSAEFDGTLVSVLQHRPPACEVIVAHTADYQDPYDLAGEVEFFHCPDETSLVGLINAGIDQAASAFIHVLACGLEATDGWTDAAIRHFADDDVDAVVPAIVHRDGSLVSAGVRLTLGGSRAVLRDQRLLLGGSGHLRAAIGAPTLAAGFYRREVLKALGGFSSAGGDALADVDLAVNLRGLDRRAVLEPAARIVQMTDTLLMAPSIPFARGRAAERLFWRQAAEAGLPMALALHIVAVASDPAALAGRLAALCELGSNVRHRSRLARAAEDLARQRELSRAPRQLPALEPARRRAA